MDYANPTREYVMVLRATNECALQNRRMSSLAGTDRKAAAVECEAIAKATEHWEDAWGRNCALATGSAA
jgi:hypothetical protein